MWSRPKLRSIPFALCIAAALGVARLAGATQGGTAVAVPVQGAELADAKRLFHEAELAMQANDRARALELMQKSYELSRYPWLLFNLGTLHRELGDCEKALQAFAQYLKDVENGKYRSEAQTSVDELSPRCGAKSAPSSAPSEPPSAVSTALANGAGAPPVVLAQAEPPGPAALRAPVPMPADRPQPYWTARPTIGAALIGGGTVAAGLAVFYGLSAKSSADELNSTISAARALPVSQRPSWSTKEQELVEERDADRTRTVVFATVSAALISSGLVLMLLPLNDGAQPKAARGRRGIAFHMAPDQLFLEYTASAF